MPRLFNQESANVPFLNPNETVSSDSSKLPQLPIQPQSMLEKVRVAYLIHMGDPHLISKELDIPLAEVNKQLRAIREDEGRDYIQLTANNIAMYIIFGIEMRMHYLNKQSKTLADIDQGFLSVCCGKPFETVAATDTTPEHTMCLGCNRECNAEKVDIFAMLRVTNEINKNIREEVNLCMKTIKELKWFDNPNMQPPAKIQLQILGAHDKAQDYLKLPPMEMGMLLKDMKKELLKVDAEIEVLEQEIEEEESEKDEEESKDGEVPGEEEVPA